MDSIFSNSTQKSSYQNNSFLNFFSLKRIVICLVFLGFFGSEMLLLSKYGFLNKGFFDKKKGQEEVLAVHDIVAYTEFQSNLKYVLNNSAEVLKGMRIRGDIDADGSNLNLGEGEITASNIIYTLTAGSGIVITGGQNPTISASIASGLSTVEGISGAIDLVAGSNISISTSGNQITINSSGSSTDTDTNTTYTAGDGLALTGTTFSVDFDGIGLEDLGTSNTTSGASVIGVYSGNFANISVASPGTDLQTVLEAIDDELSVSGGGGIAAVGNITSGPAFTSAVPGSNLFVGSTGWIGLGGTAGRVVFTDTTTDTIGFLNSNVGIGTTSPQYTLDVLGNIRAGTEIFIGSTGLTSTAGASVLGVDSSSIIYSSASDLQTVLEDLDSAINNFGVGGSGVWLTSGSYSYLNPTLANYIGNNAVGGSNKLQGAYFSDGSLLSLGSDNDFRMLFDGTNFVLGNTSSTFLSVGDSGTTGNFNFNNNQMYLRGDGRLGIGTTAPSAILSVGSANQFTVDILGAITGSTIDTGNGPFEIGFATTTNPGLASFSSSNFAVGTSGAVTIATDGVGSTELASTSVIAATYGSATGFPVFTVDADGRLTSASTTPFVAGVQYESPLTFGNGLTRTTNNIALGGSLTSNTRFFTTGTEVLYMGTNGQIGIGTTAPSYKLDVAGTARVWDLITQNISLSSLSTSNITGQFGFDGYTQFTGGIGTGGNGKDSILGAQRLTSAGNLVNIGSIQAGEMLLTNGGTFASKVDYAGSANPASVAMSDVNGDGKTDFVTADYSANTVSVYINNGNGTFATRVSYATTNIAVDLALGDINGDGKSDIAVSNAGGPNTVSVLINNGNGTFATKVDYATGDNPYGVAIGDVNGDGKADLAVANANASTVSILINNGNGTFATKVDYATGTGPRLVAIGDVSGDGKADIAVANSNVNSVSVFINNGNGTFASKVDYVTDSGGSFGVALGDLSGDGKADLAVTNANVSANSMSVFINNGNGTFASKVDYATGTNVQPITMGDINGDGKADLITGNVSSTNASVFINNGNGTFATKVDYTTGANPYGVAMGDVNGDGKKDFVTANFGASTVSVFINNANPILYAQASTGRVGIGTTSPQYSLDVVGNIRAGTELFMGNIGLNDTGSSAVTSGASLIGVYDSLDNGSSTNLQDTLRNLDLAIGNRDFTNSLLLVDNQTVTQALDALNIGIGGTAYTSTNYLTSGSAISNAVSTLDASMYNLAIGNSGVWRDSNGATAGGTVYLGDITADLALGGNGSTAPFFFDIDGGINAYKNGTNLFNLNTTLGAGTDLLSLNIPSGTTVGNLFAIYDGGSPVFKVSQSGIESAVPHTFTAAGDVSIAYDLVMTNNTAANIKFKGPGYISTEDPTGNYDLTLSAANLGIVFVDDSLLVSAGSVIGGTYVGLGVTAPVNGLLVEGSVGIGTSNPYQRFQINEDTASPFVVTSAGRVGIGTTSPVNNLTLYDASSPTLGILDSTNSVGTFMQSTDTSGIIGTSSNHGLALATNSIARMYFEADGDAGINTVVPTANMKLDVAGNIRAGTELFMGSIGLNDTGSSLSTSGASVIGVYDNLSSSTGSAETLTVQQALMDLDQVIGTRDFGSNNYVSDTSTLTNAIAALDAQIYNLSIGTSGMWRDSNGATAGGVAYLDDLTTSMAIGGTGAGSPFYFNRDSGLTIGNTANTIYTFGTNVNSGSDLFSLNLPSGSSNLTNLFAIYDNGSPIFKVSQSNIESAVPHSFTAAGDVSIAYDLNFTNATASYINFEGPGYIRTTHPSGNYNLTLSAANTGSVFIDDSMLVSAGSIIGGTYVGLGITAPQNGLLIQGNVGIGTTRPSMPFGSKGLEIGSDTHAGIFVNAPSGSVPLIALGRSGTPEWHMQADVTNNSFSLVESNVAVRLTMLEGGNLGLGTTNPSTTLDVSGSIQLNLPSTTAAFALCHATNGASTNDQTIMDCSPTAGADYMEFYPTEGEVERGDILIAGDQYGTTTQGDRLAKLKKSSQPYQYTLIGIASNPADITDFNAIGYNIKDADRPYPVALNGRVKVKVTDENGPIAVGDFITTSSIPGKGMKATKPGMIIGQALESWDASSGQGMLMVFVKPIYSDPFILAGNDGVSISRGENDYELKSTLDGEQVDSFGAFDSASIANLTAGKIDTSMLVLSGVDLSTTLDGLNLQLQTVQSELSFLDQLPEWQDSMENRLLAIENKDELVTKAELETSYQTLEKGLFDLETKMNDTIARLDSFEKEASGSADLTGLTDRVTFIEQMLFGEEASSSAQLASLIDPQESPSGEVLGIKDGKLDLEALTVTGRTNLFDLGVVGEITAGQLIIDGKDGTINTLATPLDIQSNGLADVEIMAGKVVIDTDGNLTVKETVKAKQFEVDKTDAQSASAGRVKIEAGEIKIKINTTAIKSSSLIFATSVGTPVAIGTKYVEDDTFEIALPRALEKDLEVNWWIVN